MCKANLFLHTLWSHRQAIFQLGHREYVRNNNMNLCILIFVHLDPKFICYHSDLITYTEILIIVKFDYTIIPKNSNLVANLSSPNYFYKLYLSKDVWGFNFLHPLFFLPHIQKQKNSLVLPQS